MSFLTFQIEPSPSELAPFGFRILNYLIRVFLFYPDGMLSTMQGRPNLGKERAVFGIFSIIPGGSLTFRAPIPGFQN
jgi:hypothetical protein